MGRSQARKRNLPLTPEQVSDLNRQAFEETTASMKAPDSRPMSHKQAAALRMSKRILGESVRGADTALGKAAAIQRHVDEIRAIKSEPIRDNGIDEDMDALMTEYNKYVSDIRSTSHPIGVVYDPNSHGLPKEVQDDLGYGWPGSGAEDSE